MCLPMQEAQVESTCCGTIEPVCHNYGACVLKPTLYNKRTHYSEEPECHS